jgi:transmembrane sensor
MKDMEENYRKELLKRYQRGHCTEEERAIVESWYLLYRQDADLDLSEKELAEDLAEVEEQLPGRKAGRRLLPMPVRIAAAAAILIAISFGIFLNLKKGGDNALAGKTNQETILPGGNKAVLTLADGSRVILDNAQDGEIAQLQNMSIRKTAEGRIIYVIEDMKTAAGAADSYNTIETPKGGQYEVQLPDGSRVWLNAASSLRYPVHFASGERKVELRGEAYFEVAHDKKKPFRVHSGGQTVEVLGTSFNVNAYEDEQSVNTTLLEGSVKVIAGNSGRIILPGQQSRLFKSSAITVAEVNTESAIAWKNGYFKFDDTDLVSLMRQLSRWYDFDVVYEGKPSDEVFIGQIRRDASLSNVLKIIELGDVNFRVDGRTLYIKP